MSNWFDFLKRFFDELSKPTPVATPPPPPPVVPKLSITWAQSPNFSSRQRKKVQVIVLHHTGSLSVKSAISWFQTPQSQVSAHYVVDRNGDVTQMVKEEDKAWHAGDSLWNGNKNVNAVSIGIEIVGDGKTPFTDAQYEAVALLCREIKSRHSLGASRKVIVGHADIAQPAGRKIDPRPWDWERFFSLVDNPPLIK